MSIEQEIQNLTSATSELTAVSQKIVEEVSGKMDSIDLRMKQSEDLLESKAKESTERVSALIRSSYQNLKLAAISLHIPDEIYVGEQVELKITNFDSQTHYHITAQFGYATCVKDVILYTAPKFPVDDNLIINVNGEKRLIPLHIQKNIDDHATSTDTDVSLNEGKHFGIGTPGSMGFGVGPSDVTPAWLNPYDGCFDPESENYGNYYSNIHGDYVHIPAFYYRSGHPESSQYEKYKQHALDIKDFYDFDNEEEANSYGYVLHRAFIDGGEIKKGFFIHKYLCSENIEFRSVQSKKNDVPMRVGLRGSIHHILNVDDDDSEAYLYVKAAKKIRNGHNVVSIFMHSALSMLTMAHGQAAKNRHMCAWLDLEGTKNFPRGCHHQDTKKVGHFYDIYESTVHWKSQHLDLYNFALTGSCSEFPKSTHNGQPCGVADLSGLVSEYSIGCGVSTLEDGRICLLVTPKSERFTDMSDITESMANKVSYDRIFIKKGCQVRLGGDEPVIKGDIEGEMYLRDSILFPCDNATSESGMNIYGCDYLMVNPYNFHEGISGSCLLGVHPIQSKDSAGWGIYSRYFGYYLQNTYHSHYTNGFRCATYG